MRAQWRSTIGLKVGNPPIVTNCCAAFFFYKTNIQGMTLTQITSRLQSVNTMKSTIVLFLVVITLVSSSSAAVTKTTEMEIAERMLSDMGLSKRPDYQHVSCLCSHSHFYVSPNYFLCLIRCKSNATKNMVWTHTFVLEFQEKRSFFQLKSAQVLSNLHSKMHLLNSFCCRFWIIE